MCFARLQQPAVTSGIFSWVYSMASGLPAETGGPPPCIFNARTVATITAHLGLSPDSRHLILKNSWRGKEKHKLWHCSEPTRSRAYQ